MGWCSGTEIFDDMAEIIVDESKPLDRYDLIKTLIISLQSMDWDCECDSEYWEHPVVREIFMELEPEWFEDEDELD